jgi:mRNA interferase RelE/StbE
MSKTIYEIALHREAERELRKLPGPVRARVSEAISALAHEPRPPGARQLRGRRGAYRLRVGDHQIIYEIHATEIVIYVLGIGHRREVYRRILRRR